jgi:hypothetical protein
MRQGGARKAQGDHAHGHEQGGNDKPYAEKPGNCGRTLRQVWQQTPSHQNMEQQGETKQWGKRHKKCRAAYAGGEQWRDLDDVHQFQFKTRPVI